LDAKIDDATAASVRLLHFDPEGTLLLTGSDDRMIALWDTSSWQCLANWCVRVLCFLLVGLGSIWPQCLLQSLSSVIREYADLIGML
jgi:WD40 repeat protein